MSDMQQPRQTGSGISVGGQNKSADYGLTATVSLSRKGMGPSRRVDSSQSPSTSQLDQIPRAVATENSVKCPTNGCNAEFEIDPSLYGEVGQCELCNAVFYIEAPGSTRAPQAPAAQEPLSSQVQKPAQVPNMQKPSIPDPMTTVEMSRGDRPGRNTNPAPPPSAPAPAVPPAPAPRTTSSGIQTEKPGASKEYGLTATVTLSRSGMGMMQKKKGEMPAPNQMRFSVARGNEVACPNCQTVFPITPEVYGAIAECSECACEFQIRAPGGAGAPAPAPAPTPTQAPAPAPARAPAPQPAPSTNAPRPSSPQPRATRSARPSRGRTRTSTRNKAAGADLDAAAPVGKSGGSNTLVIVLAVVIVVLVAVMAVGGFILMNK